MCIFANFNPGSKKMCTFVNLNPGSKGAKKRGVVKQVTMECTPCLDRINTQCNASLCNTVQYSAWPRLHLTMQCWYTVHCNTLCNALLAWPVMHSTILLRLMCSPIVQYAQKHISCTQKCAAIFCELCSAQCKICNALNCRLQTKNCKLIQKKHTHSAVQLLTSLAAAWHCNHPLWSNLWLTAVTHYNAHCNSHFVQSILIQPMTHCSALHKTVLHACQLYFTESEQ